MLAPNRELPVLSPNRELPVLAPNRSRLPEMSQHRTTLVPWNLRTPRGPCRADHSATFSRSSFSSAVRARSPTWWLRSSRRASCWSGGHRSRSRTRCDGRSNTAGWSGSAVRPTGRARCLVRLAAGSRSASRSCAPAGASDRTVHRRRCHSRPRQSDNRGRPASCRCDMGTSAPPQGDCHRVTASTTLTNDAPAGASHEFGWKPVGTSDCPHQSDNRIFGPRLSL